MCFGSADRVMYIILEDSYVWRGVIVVREKEILFRNYDNLYMAYLCNWVGALRMCWQKKALTKIWSD